MIPADAITFLRRKLDCIVRCTADPDDRKALPERWEPVFGGIAPDEKLAALQKLDRALEKDLKRCVYDWDIDALREKLAEEFGLSRLTDDEIEQATPPAPLPDDIVLSPSGRRPVKRQYRDFVGIERATIDISTTTVGELAQIYSDYSGKPVRLTAALARRQTRFGAAAASESGLLAVFRNHLEMLHVYAVRDGNGIVLKDTSARDQALAEANRSKEATAEEIQRAAAAMSIDRFWEMVATASKKGEALIVAKLQAALNRCSREEILGFQLRLEECLAASYRWDLWAVAYIIEGGCSDDGFEYFRGWLIAQGRAYFEAALADPEPAADRAEGREVECEEILSVAQQAFARRSKKPMPHGLTSRPQHPIGQDWKEEDVPRLFPRLSKKFG